jgi:hypothetical protein
MDCLIGIITMQMLMLKNDGKEENCSMIGKNNANAL